MNYFSSLTKLLKHPTNRDHFWLIIIRILWWKVNQILFKLPIVVELTPGVKLICNPSSAYGGLVVYSRLPEYAEMRFVLEYLRSTDVFIDVGSNPGDFALLAASKISSGRVFAFEPTQTGMSYIRENLKLNQFSKRIKVYQKAVSNQNGQALFLSSHVSEVSRLVTNTKPSQNNNQQLSTVPTIKLDTFLQRHRVKMVNLLKIDVEGAEQKVLKGLENYLSQGKVEAIIFEANPGISDYGSSIGQLLLFLKKHHFRIYEFKQHQRLIPIKIRQFRLDRTTNLLAVLSTNSRFNSVRRAINRYH